MRVVLVALALTSAGAHAQTSLDIYAQRALARALDDRCSLFSEQERTALDGAYLQARGELLRGGYSADAVDQSYQQVTRNAASRSCTSDETVNLTEAIRFAFAGWLRERTQDYISAPSVWQATRPFAYDSWVISQALNHPDLPIIIGVYNRGGNKAVTAAIPPGVGISTLAIQMRNPDQTALFDPTLGGLLTIDDAPEWTRFLPPEQDSHRFMATERITTEDGVYFSFSQTALDGLLQLDPREAFRIEAFNRNGERVARRYVGVGDFAAALLFVRSSPDLSAGR